MSRTPQVVDNPEQFDKDVIGPIGLHMRVEDPDAAKIINKEMRNEANAFIVQSHGDFQKLREIAPKAKIYTIKMVERLPYKPPYDSATLKKFEGFGFVGYVRTKTNGANLYHLF